MIEYPIYKEKRQLYDYLVENKSMLINQKKAAIKHTDGISFVLPAELVKEASNKAEAMISQDASKLFVRSIINTTKLFDSHLDVHIDGLWKKSISENKDNYLVEEHKFNFKGIISDNVEVYTKSMSWKSLGYSADGNTEALIYDSILNKDRNEYMFEQYAKKRVKNHSVGMRYIKLFMAINSPLYDEEFETWNKYFDIIANKEDAENRGFFWAVTEAKNIEGSAVVRGSNWVTPTQVIEEKQEPVITTLDKDEPSNDTQKEQAVKFLSNIKF